MDGRIVEIVWTVNSCELSSRWTWLVQHETIKVTTELIIRDDLPRHSVEIGNAEAERIDTSILPRQCSFGKVR